MPPTDPREDAPKATHRLRNMIVQEISFVDKAANGETFLIAKRFNMSTKVKKEDAATAAANVADDNAGASTTTATDAMQAQVKEELTSELASFAEKIVSLATQADAAAVTDQPATPPVPVAITTQIADIAQGLAALAAKYGGAPVTASAEGDEAPAGSPDAEAAKSAEDDEEKKKLTDAEKKAVAGAEAEITAKGMKPAKHPDLIAKTVAARLAVSLSDAQRIVQKAGRRMAKERLERLGKAIDMLIGLLKELRYDSERRAAKAAADRAAAAQSKTEKSADGAVEITKAEVLALLDETDVLVAANARATSELAKAQSEAKTMRARVAELEKRTGPSNLLPPLQVQAAPTSTAKVVHWPADMNDLPGVKSALAGR